LLYRTWFCLRTGLLLVYQPIDYCHDLVGQADLAKCSYTCREKERP
jgi:hypothetical protein